MKAIEIRAHGGPEVLALHDLADPEPGPGEARVRLARSGVNFIDVYHRTGAYPVPPPFVPGMEGAGVVDDVGDDVPDVSPGDRVAFAMHRGAYAEAAVVPAWKLVPLPDDVDWDTAAAVMLQGMTAHYLARSTFPLGPGHVCLVHAAAGGVGQLLVQMARHAGARVLGTVGTEEKGRIVKDLGGEPIVYTQGGFRDAVRDATDGAGVHVVYDSVGQATFDDSMSLLRPRGMLVLFGASSGPVPPMDPQRLNRAGSVYLTRPNLADYAASRAELLGRAHEIFAGLREGWLRVRVDRTYPLAQAAHAHEDLESRRTAGKLLLET